MSKDKNILIFDEIFTDIVALPKASLDRHAYLEQFLQDSYCVQEVRLLVAEEILTLKAFAFFSIIGNPNYFIYCEVSDRPL